MKDKYWIKDEEMKVIMRQAKDKKNQVAILSQLCECKGLEMIQHLKDIGADYGVQYVDEDFDDIRGVRGRKSKYGIGDYEKERIRDMYTHGYSSGEIAKVLGCTPYAVLYNVKKMNLPITRQMPKGGRL